MKKRWGICCRFMGRNIRIVNDIINYKLQYDINASGPDGPFPPEKTDVRQI